MKTEYRLVWIRQGGYRKVRRFQSLAGAQRHIVRLTGPGVDPHYRCDHDSRPCEPLPPIVDGPHLQTREATPWAATNTEGSAP